MIYKILRKTKGEIGNQAEVLSLRKDHGFPTYYSFLSIIIIIPQSISQLRAYTSQTGE
jgi:hypothetical protein